MKQKLREPVSGITHLVGVLLALVALIVLLTKAAGRTDQLVAFGIFGLSLIALYGASALYHLLPVSASAKTRLRRLDHMTIFILIAGTYTPICVLALEGGWRSGMLSLVWTLALCCILLKLLWMDAPRWLSVGIYRLQCGRPDLRSEASQPSGSTSCGTSSSWREAPAISG